MRLSKLKCGRTQSMPNVSIPQLLFVVVAGGLLTQALLLLAQGQGAVLQRNWYNFWSWLTGAPRREGFQGADVANAYVTQYSADVGSWREPPASVVDPGFSAPVLVTADYDPTDYAAVEPPPPPPPAVTKLPPAIGIRDLNMARDMKPMTAGPAPAAMSYDSGMATFGSPL